MTYVKAYTDISQSKVLAKILSPESADMFYIAGKGEPIFIGNNMVTYGEDDYDALGEPDVLCWSLAALFDIFPPYLFEFERGIDFNAYPNLNGKGWHCSYMPNCIENMKKDKFRLVTSEDSLVDACYEMILKLNKQNLI